MLRMYVIVGIDPNYPSVARSWKLLIADAVSMAVEFAARGYRDVTIMHLREGIRRPLAWWQKSFPNCKVPTMKKPKRPTDVVGNAVFVMGLATGQIEEKPQKAKNEAAVALGRLGGLKGGAARKKALTKKQRVESARKAAKSRWGHR